MKKHIITALLITTMISMTACGGKNTDTPAEESNPRKLLPDKKKDPDSLEIPDHQGHSLF